MRVFNRGGRLSPYLLGGAGYLRTEPEGFRKESGASYSAGLGVLLDFTERAALRGEYRFRNETAFDHNDHFVSLGLRLLLGDVRGPDPTPTATESPTPATVAQVHPGTPVDGVRL